MENLENIKNEIQINCPIITDEALELLYQYITGKFAKQLNDSIR